MNVKDDLPPRILVIGLDGGTFDLLRPLIAQGHMPRLEHLLETGSWGQLESTIPPFTAAAWSTFATGKNPGQHGILSFQKTDRFRYHEQATGFADARQVRQPLWTLLSEANKRVAVINVPLTYPPRPVNGIMITGMMTPSNASDYTYPPQIASSLSDYQIDVNFIREGEAFRRYGLPSKNEMLAEIRAVTQKRTAVCQRLLTQEAWDFFMVVYTGTDRVSHFFWDDLKPIWDKRPSTSATSSILRELLAYFHDLDNDIGQLLDTVGRNTHVFLMSDHGFGASPTKRFAVNLWLEQQNLLCAQKPKGINTLAYWRMKVGRAPWLKKIARWALTQETQDKLVQKAVAQTGSSGILWEKTRAYFVPIYFHVCGIEINTVGDHQEGIVQFNEAYEALRTQVIIAVQQLRDQETGEKIVDVAARREELFSGPYVSQFPDVVLVLKPEYVGGQSLAGSKLVESHVPFRSGEHRPDGIFIANGPSIRPQADLPNLHLADISPTLLYLAGLPVPDNLDGRILQEIIMPDHLAAHSPVYKNAVEPAMTISSPLHSEEEEADLTERLRGLGYME